METEFIPFEEHQDLLKLGFGHPYHEQSKSVENGYTCVASWHQAFKFFRSHGIDSDIMRDPIGNTLYGKTYDWVVTETNEIEYGSPQNYWSYEDAELGCLKKLIEVLKDRLATKAKEKG